MLSIIIPTWNNLEYLKLCIASIGAHSAFDHEIIVHVNDGSDGTLEWVRSEGLKHTYSRANIGVCLATNYLAGKATRDWLLYMNDDMVCCPGWDTALIEAMRATPTSLAMFFSTLIEPTETGNPLVLVRDFGATSADFDRAGLLAGYSSPVREDILGQAAQPTLVHRMWWHIVGGYSPEFGPGTQQRHRSPNEIFRGRMSRFSHRRGEPALSFRVPQHGPRTTEPWRPNIRIEVGNHGKGI